MKIRLATLLLTSTLAFAADPLWFIQASDPQFGMFTNNADFRQETANWEFAVANFNRLHPAFVVVTGDLTNKAADEAQIAEFARINRELDPSIHLYKVPGNHDQTNDPTQETLAAYRKNYGPDYYSFREPGVYGIVLNSTILKSPAHVPEEQAKEMQWIEAELPKAQASGDTVVVFMHHPPFVSSADEPAGENLPPEIRERLLALLHQYGVQYVFAGHLHRNAEVLDDELEIYVTSASGKPLGADPSGFRIGEVSGGEIVNRFYGLGEIPSHLPALVK
ncbi:MAG TPA: metallophosphoesterase [Bryobacteraceae bacterium]|nr:metallophosphoesterase [Bryobacteraceae bacterium]